MSAPYILLINPWIYDFAAYDLWSKPLGLLYLASLLRANGYNVHLIDCLDPNHPRMHELFGTKILARKKTGEGRFFNQQVAKPDPLKIITNKRYKRYGILPELFEENIAALPEPGLILVTSMMTYWYPGVFEVIRRVKLRYPRVPVVLGGVYATICYEHALKFSGADIVVRGPGEAEVLRLAAVLTGRNPSIPPAIQNDSFPCPACDLLSSKAALPIITARGCPFSCTYCASSRLFSGFSRRDPMSVVNEIEHWVLHAGTTDFAFYDDAFMFQPATHALPLLQEIIKRKLKIRFHFPNGLHIRYFTQKIADVMMAAGCKTIRLGLETADTKRQKVSGGKVATQEFISTAGFLRAAGFTAAEAGAYILAGLPGQKAREVLDTIRLVKSSGLKPVIAEYSPIPGTELWEQAIAASPFPINAEPLFHNNTLLPCQWEEFSLSDLNELKTEARSITANVPWQEQ